MREPLLHRVLGGSPLGVLLRLLVVSLAAGALMTWMNVDPSDILREVERLAAHLYATGFDGLARGVRMVLAGAAIVVPVWIVVRVVNLRSLRQAREEPGPLPGAVADPVRTEPTGWRRRNGPSPSGP